MVGNDGTELDTVAVKVTKPLIIIDGVSYRIINETMTLKVVSYEGSSASLVIPQSPVSGYTVTEIGEGAFENNTTLVSIDLPDTITIIGKCAFKNCTNLREMN